MKNLKNKNNAKYCETDEAIPHAASKRRVAINTTFLPFVSAKQPQKYEPITIPGKKRDQIRLWITPIWSLTEERAHQA